MQVQNQSPLSHSKVPVHNFALLKAAGLRTYLMSTSSNVVCEFQYHYYGFQMELMAFHVTTCAKVCRVLNVLCPSYIVMHSGTLFFMYLQISAPATCPHFSCAGIFLLVYSTHLQSLSNNTRYSRLTYMYVKFSRCV